MTKHYSRPANTEDADKDDDETDGETNERDGDDQQNYNKKSKQQSSYRTDTCTSTLHNTPSFDYRYLLIIIRNSVLTQVVIYSFMKE